MALRESLEQQGNFLFKYRSYLPIFIILAGMAIYAYGRYSGQIRQELWIDLVCLGISLEGLLIRVLTIGYSADQTSGRNTTEGQIADEVNSTGMYSLVRHPLYVGNFFMWLGIACMTQHIWFVLIFILVYWLYYERIMYAEEAFLTDKFGTGYTQWADSVPTFIPKLKGWKKPKYSFSWIKVIRQEKAGILNLFLTFYLLWIVGSIVSGNDFSSRESIWFYGLVAAVAWYLIIKLIQKSTDRLDRDRP